MRLRSLLFVPGDRPDRFEKAERSGTDALILDLEDAVAQGAKDAAREAVAERLTQGRAGVRLLVRVNPLGTPLFARDVAALKGLSPDAIMLPKAEGAVHIIACAMHLAEAGIEAPILPIATETPAAIFQLGTYAQERARLFGLTWGAEDLPAAIGAATSREADGRFTPPYEMARSLALFAAHAAGVAAIETVYPAFQDEAGLAAFAGRAARDGFTGMMAIHPRQIAAINAAFTPDAESVAGARRIVEAFAATPNAGALQVDGRMVDAPHLAQARNLLARMGDAE